MPAAVIGIPAGTAAASVTQIESPQNRQRPETQRCPPTEVLVNFICFSPFQSKVVFQTFVCVFKGVGPLFAQPLGKLQPRPSHRSTASTVRFWVLLHQISPQLLLICGVGLLLVGKDPLFISPSNNASAVSRASFSS